MLDLRNVVRNATRKVVPLSFERRELILKFSPFVCFSYQV